MIVRVYEVLAPLVARVWISVAEERPDLPINAEQVVDRYAEAGPLAGIHAAMRATDAGALLVLAADIPYITREVLLAVLTTSAGLHVPVVVRTPDRRLQPLCGRYPTALLPEVESHLGQGRRSMHGFLEACAEVAVVDVPAVPLANFNRE